MVYLSIVIPCRNEETSLPILCQKLEKVLIENLKDNWEVILVDDASTDNSYEIMKQYQKNSLFRIIHFDKRKGQTGAFKAAFDIARGEYIIRMDGDLQDDPKDIPKFLEKLKEGSELTLGLRECRKHSKILRLASGIFDLAAILLFDSPLHSSSASFVAFKSEFVKNIPFRKNDHRYLPLIAMKRGAKNVSEIFVTHNERIGDKSKYPKFKKIILGGPELLFFLIRYKLGVYDKKTK